MPYVYVITLSDDSIYVGFHKGYDKSNAQAVGRLMRARLRYKPLRIVDVQLTFFDDPKDARNHESRTILQYMRDGAKVRNLVP